MPKLITSANASPLDDGRTKQPEMKPVCRPCPRCFVPLVLERHYRTTGLSGKPTVHSTYICPACDARYQHNPDGRWKELS